MGKSVCGSKTKYSSSMSILLFFDDSWAIKKQGFYNEGIGIG